MRLKGIQKAALLLSTLDPQTAMELLKGQPQEMIHRIALELSQLDARGMQGSEEASQVAREFCVSLQKTQSGSLHVKSFVNNLLGSAGGKDKAAELQAKMEKVVREKDPFLVIANSPPAQILAVIENEPPQVIALVLSALPSKLSTEILNRLDPEKSLRVVWRMTQPGEVSAKTIRRIGEIVCKRLAELNANENIVTRPKAPKETLRKVALVLSGLEKERRDAMLKEIEGRNLETARTVKALMITWEDIPKIENRSLQQILRNIEAGTLAKALHGADPIIAEKIRMNISERTAQMIEEEASLMSEPRKKEIAAAREEVVKPLREANEAEQLMFIEDEEEVE